MENIEDKLKNHRLLKRRREQTKYLKDNIMGYLMLGIKNNANEQRDKTTLTKHETQIEVPLKSSIDAEIDDGSDDILSSEDEMNSGSNVKFCVSDSIFFKYTLRLLYLVFWVTLYVIAIELQFGIVFLMFSALAGIYLNTRTGPKKSSEISAYSVFNKNCESIDGTLKPEQFEREIGIR